MEPRDDGSYLLMATANAGRELPAFFLYAQPARSENTLAGQPPTERAPNDTLVCATRSKKGLGAFDVADYDSCWISGKSCHVVR